MSVETEATAWSEFPYWKEVSEQRLTSKGRNYCKLEGLWKVSVRGTRKKANNLS